MAPGLPVTIRPPFEPCAKVVTARSISRASRTSATRKSTPREGATAWRTPNWPGPAATEDCRKTIARVMGRNLFEQLQPFRGGAVFEHDETGSIAAGPRQAFDVAGTDRVGDGRKHNRNGSR